MVSSKFKNLIASMRKYGFTDPIKIRPVLEGKEEISTPYVIVDGEHRYRAFMEVFPDSTGIDCVITPMDNLAEAMQATDTANRIKGEPNPIKEAELFDYIIKEGISYEEIEELSGLDQILVENMVNSLDIPEIPEDDIDELSGSSIDNGKTQQDDSDKKIIVSFSIYADQKEKINKAINMIDETLDIQIPDEDRKGEALFVMSNKYLENQ